MRIGNRVMIDRLPPPRLIPSLYVESLVVSLDVVLAGFPARFCV